MILQFALRRRLFATVAATAILAGCGGGGGGGGGTPTAQSSWTIPEQSVVDGGPGKDVIPAVQYHVNELLALAASAKIPVERDLNDQLQFTTNYAFGLSLSYVLGDDASPGESSR